MTISIKSFDRIIFDFDGVIMDTNDCKKESFYSIFKKIGINKNKFDSLLSPGKTRYEIIKDALCIKKKEDELNISQYEEILNEYSEIAFTRLKKCRHTNFFKKNESIFKQVKSYVVSAASEEELKRLMIFKGLDNYFKLENVYGSPKSKIQNIKELIDAGRISNQDKVLLIGDSESDLKVSEYFNFNFIFVSDWSGENQNRKEYLINNYPSIKSLDKLEII